MIGIKAWTVEHDGSSVTATLLVGEILSPLEQVDLDLLSDADVRSIRALFGPAGRTQWQVAEWGLQFDSTSLELPLTRIAMWARSETRHQSWWRHWEIIRDRRGVIPEHRAALGVSL